MYDYLIFAPQLFEKDGGAMGGTERQIVTVAEKLASENFNVGLVHSLTDGSDRIINDVKHLNVFRHHYARSRVRIHCNQIAYNGNSWKNYYMYNPHIPVLSPLEINSGDKTYIWLHNWTTCHEEVPRLFLSNALKNYVQGKGKKVAGDQTIHYMVPKDMDKQKPKEKRSNYLFWMSAFGKGFREALTIYVALYDKGMKRPFYVCCPPQRQKKDVKIFTDFMADLNKDGYPIHFLGELNYEGVLKSLSNAACLFRAGMPQETFGLVYLEANKLGVPVITHESDAAEEILTDENNMFIRKDTTIDDVYNWTIDIEKRKTSVDMKKFDPDKIIKKWINLLK
ncbi:MAG: hypothetical protein CL707_08595 [Chloroflexi bacterium]|nr:hypothetical protein [Chloroflexota bacterium]